jgi:two-component system, cell cycle response regulator
LNNDHHRNSANGWRFEGLPWKLFRQHIAVRYVSVHNRPFFRLRGLSRNVVKVELLKHNLAIEPDLQNFLHFVLMAVKDLGGNAFVGASSTVGLVQRLRAAGAASGYPLEARLLLEKAHLKVEWGEAGSEMIVKLKKLPPVQVMANLRREFQQSTKTVDPAILLKRNAEMVRYLDETRAHTEKEIALMQQALAEHQEELRESLRQAETDPLTGLYNRRAFDEKIELAFRRVLRQGNEALSLVLLDLDFFKQVNDEHGHQFGDAYLNKAAHAMLDAIRCDVDMAFRTGGDEFAMLLFANATASCKRALEVLKAMNNRISIGIATISGESSQFEKTADFIRCADDALYQAKRSGRGRVVVSACQREGFAGCAEHCIEFKNDAKRA